MSSGLGAAQTFLYFAYGSNLCSERIHLNNKSAIMKSVGLLKGYRLGFGYMSQRWKGAAANIYPDQESHVYGVLWELNVPDKESLDTQEGVLDGIYERVEIEVQTEGKSVGCYVYKLTETCKQKSLAAHGSNLLPSTVYKNVIIRGAKEHKLPPEYIKFLEDIPDNGYNGEVDFNLVEPK